MTIGNRILLYGATGYMGQLLALRAAQLKLPVVLAARDATKLAELAESVNLPYLAFALESPKDRAERLKRQPPARPSSRGKAKKDAAKPFANPNRGVDKALANVGVVLNAAGPFAETAEPLARACMRTKTHYVDISGEYDVFRALRTLYDEAGQPDIAVVPGAGLTPLGSGLLLQQALTAGTAQGMGEPHTVRVALSRVPAVSRGSAKTMLESVRNGVRIHQNGSPMALPVGSLVRSFHFGSDQAFRTDDARICTAITLADAVTVNATVTDALNSGSNVRVAVPNVETYVEATSLEQFAYELGSEFSLPLRTFPLKCSLDYALSFWPEGPTEDDRRDYHQQVVVEVEDRYRRGVSARLLTPNSQDFTVAAALTAANLLLTDRRGETGFLAPSQIVTQQAFDKYLPAKACHTITTTHGSRSSVTSSQSFP